MIRIVNIKSKPTPYYTMYIGRANKWLGLPQSKFANPFPMKRESDRDYVVSEFEKYARNNQEIMDSLHELKDQILACYCHNDEPGHKLCHGDILRKLYEEKYGKTI